MSHPDEASDSTAGDRPPGLYARLALHIFDHSRIWATGLTLVTLLCVLLGTQMTINPNILELLPSDDPTTRAIQKINAEEGGTNVLTVAIKGDDPAAVDAYARSTAATLRALPGVDYALYDIEPELAWKVGVLQLDTGELGLIRDRLTAALAMGPAAANPFIAAKLMDLGPLTDKLARKDGRTAFTRADGAARILVRPTGSAYDPAFAKPFLASVRQTLDETDPAGHGVRIAWLGGAHRHAVDELLTIVHDLGSTTIVSTSLIFVLLVFAFREVRALWMILVPLFVGTCWGWGFAGATVGTINSFTSFSGAIVLGLGIDFCIHLYSRYREERKQTGDTRLAIARAWDETAPPCFTAAITTAAGFVALLVASFQGFRQLGIILSAGVMLCFLAAVVVLPLLLRWSDGLGSGAPPPPEASAPTTVPSYRFGPPGLLGLAAITVVALVSLPRIGFEYDLSALRSEGMAYEDLSEESRALAVDSFSPVVVTYPDAASLAAAHTRLSAAVANGEMPEIKRVISIHSLLPVDQAERVAILKEISTLAKSEGVVYLPGPLQENLRRFAAAEPAVMASTDLPRELQHVLGASAGHHRLLLMPQGNMWDLREDHKLAAAIDQWCPGLEAANEYLASNVLYRLMHEDAPVVAGLAILLVAALTWLDLRNIARTGVAMAALLAGACWAGAGLVGFDVKVSIVNFVGIPILLGIGMDVIVHLLHRIETEGPGGVMRALRTTGFAAGISTTNNVLSFVALLAANNRGVRSLGEMIVIGLTLMTLSGFVVVPFFWMTVWRLKGKHGPG